VEHDAIANLIENEKEWRRFMIEKMERIEERLTDHIAWQLVFRIAGATVFAIFIAWIEFNKN